MIFVIWATKRQELYDIKKEYIEECNNPIVVKISERKTRLQSSFVVIKRPNKRVTYLDIHCISQLYIINMEAFVPLVQNQRISSSRRTNKPDK